MLSLADAGFLSTPSSQRATWGDFSVELREVFLSTPSSQRATILSTCCPPVRSISIHALFAEGDGIRARLRQRPYLFLSTPSSQRATCALCAAILGIKDFYPRPLRRGRHNAVVYREVYEPFLSTPSSQRATRFRKRGIPEKCISIHALFAEGDRYIFLLPCFISQFLSTPSSQRATTRAAPLRPAVCYFYPRPLRRGRLDRLQKAIINAIISIHALFAEGDC